MKDQPKIFVECLAAYNSGISVGDWITIPDSLEDLQKEVDLILNKYQSSADWAIHDYENFGPFKIGEYESLESIIKKAEILSKVDDLEAFTAWISYVDFQYIDADEILDRFNDEFLGVYDNPEDYAYNLYNECYEIPKHLENYIDYKAIWKDLTYNGYFSEYCGGNYYIFRNQ